MKEIRGTRRLAMRQVHRSSTVIARWTTTILIAGACILVCEPDVTAQTGVGTEPARGWAPKTEGPQYFAVIVSDVDRSAHWYRRAFGLRELDRSKATNGMSEIVNLISDDLFVEIIRDDTAVPVSKARGFAKVGFYVPSVESVADVVAQDTGQRPRVIDFARHSVRILQIRDPDGNLIQLLSRHPK
jgi:catechol 2,3-dioxygenase-like lactoylglutathione lyase family enzyme